MNLLTIMSNLYLFLVALVITIGILMVILFFSLYNRDETNEELTTNLITPQQDDVEILQNK
jgi:Ca2+/Na+ antiporter